MILTTRFGKMSCMALFHEHQHDLLLYIILDSKLHGANMGPTWVMLAPWTLLSGMQLRPDISNWHDRTQGEQGPVWISKPVLCMYGDFHVRDKTAVRRSNL